MTATLTLNIAIIFSLILFECFWIPSFMSHPSGFQYCTRLGSIIFILYRTSILFIKSELHCGRLSPLSSSSISLKGHDIQYFLPFHLNLDICRLDNANAR